jgi:alkylation response protein AidB-like acyl-CoA dehydrogenase
LTADLDHLDSEQAALFLQARSAARDVLLPLARDGKEGRVNRPLVRALAENALLSRIFPSGGAASALDLCLTREALATECTEAETAFALQGLGAYPILLAGTDEAVSCWIPPVASGQAVAAFALTEPGAGSDVAALTLAATREHRGWRLSGSKTFISNAPDADVYSLFARTTGGRGAHGMTAFAVPGDAEGIAGSRIEMLSPHPIGRLELNGVFVADEQVLGEVDGGFRVAMRTLDLFRPSVGAFAVGMAQAALEAALDHAERRRSFGKSLRDHQAISHLLAEMATRTHSARLLVHEAARAYDRRERPGGATPVTRLAAMAKLLATETAQFVVDSAVQIHGAVALERGHPLEHLYREVRAPRIYEGTSEIQREIISRQLYRERAG